jgi:ribosome recycling factor
MNPADKTEINTRMNKTVDALKSEFATVRAGRANPAVLDQINVDYYGQPTPIAQIATISVPDPRTISIQPWDTASLKLIEKAIQTSELGINPANDGKIIRLLFPQLTEERRKELVKQVKNYGEEGKVAIRNIRRDYAEKFKAQKKKSEITEDDLKDSDKDLQKMTDDFIRKIDELSAVKEKELYEI